MNDCTHAVVSSVQVLPVQQGWEAAPQAWHKPPEHTAPEAQVLLAQQIFPGSPHALQVRLEQIVPDARHVLLAQQRSSTPPQDRQELYEQVSAPAVHVLPAQHASPSAPHEPHAPLVEQVPPSPGQVVPAAMHVPDTQQPFVQADPRQQAAPAVPQGWQVAAGPTPSQMAFAAQARFAQHATPMVPQVAVEVEVAVDVGDVVVVVVPVDVAVGSPVTVPVWVDVGALVAAPVPVDVGALVADTVPVDVGALVADTVPVDVGALVAVWVAVGALVATPVAVDVNSTVATVVLDDVGTAVVTPVSLVVGGTLDLVPVALDVPTPDVAELVATTVEVRLAVALTVPLPVPVAVLSTVPVLPTVTSDDWVTVANLLPVPPSLLPASSRKPLELAEQPAAMTTAKPIAQLIKDRCFSLMGESSSRWRKVSAPNIKK